MTVPPSWSYTKSERTEVVYDTENTTNAILNFLSAAQIKMDICADSTWPSVAMGIDLLKKALINVKERGIKTSYLTEITRDNLPYCKELIKIGELHHLDGIKGNFAVSEKEYIASATMREASLLQQATIFNSVFKMVDLKSIDLPNFRFLCLS